VLKFRANFRHNADILYNIKACTPKKNYPRPQIKDSTPRDNSLNYSGSYRIGNQSITKMDTLKEMFMAHSKVRYGQLRREAETPYENLPQDRT
jgi:hypothetical protein